jgi:hypothetical protein
MHSCGYCQQTFAKKSQLMEHHPLSKHLNTFTCGVYWSGWLISTGWFCMPTPLWCFSFRWWYRLSFRLYNNPHSLHGKKLSLLCFLSCLNHPDQYYTITKEKGKKMPRFNTESNEYRVTFNELNVQIVPDILKTLQNLFDSVLTDVTSFRNLSVST